MPARNWLSSGSKKLSLAAMLLMTLPVGGEAGPDVDCRAIGLLQPSAPQLAHRIGGVAGDLIGIEPEALQALARAACNIPHDSKATFEFSREAGLPSGN